MASKKFINTEFKSRWMAWDFANTYALNCEYSQEGDILQTPSEWESGLNDGYVVRFSMDSGMDELGAAEYKSEILKIQKLWENFAKDIRTNFEDYHFEIEDIEA
jgi:hypothetical protein